MCAPMLLGAGLSMAVGVMSASMQHQAAMQDYEAKSAVWRQNVVNSEAAARDEQRQIMNNQIQEQGKTIQKKHTYDLEGAQKSATAENAAASAGVGGVSINHILDDLTAKTEVNKTYADENAKWVAADLQNKMRATDSTLASRINSVQRPVEPADTTGIALLGGLGKLAGAGLNV